MLDRSSPAGAALPVTFGAGDPVLSAPLTIGTPFTLLAERHQAAAGNPAPIVLMVCPDQERDAFIMGSGSSADA